MRGETHGTATRQFRVECALNPDRFFLFGIVERREDFRKMGLLDLALKNAEDDFMALVIIYFTSGSFSGLNCMRAGSG